MFKKGNRWFDQALELLQTVVFSFVFVMILTTIFVKPVRVYGNSMYPTLHDGDTGFSSIISVLFHDIDRFDIVVIELDSTNEHLVKRVVGLPNEQICYIENRLYIDGELLDEAFLDQDYMDAQITGGNFTSNIGCRILQKGEYFVLGDNRPYSNDSRYYGAFREDQIISKGVFVVWPLSDFGAK